MRLINEDAVLEIIERVTNEAVEKRQPKYLIQPRIIAEIAGLPTIEAEPDNGWINVKDRLPDVSTAHTSQLVMVFSTNNEYEIYFDVYNSLSGKFMSEAQNGCKVTHWRPLPEPPKGE